MSVAHWENYYRGGALATCPMGPGAGYTLEMREVWLAFFSDLPDGAKVLDVGTGNGVIALFAKEAAGAAGRHYEIHGTDLAQIDPVRDVRDGAALFTGIRFHPRVPTEQLPFGPGVFVAVSGHYALEYTQVDASLREVFRVLKPGGRAQFIVHHAGSVLVRNARESLRQSDLVLNDTKVFRKLRRHLEAERRSAVAARTTWQQLEEAVTLLRRTASQVRPALTLDITVDAVSKLLDLRRELRPDALEREIDRVENDVRASVRRLQDLVVHAQSAEAIAGIERMARASGFDGCNAQLQHHAEQKLVGWRLNLEKPYQAHA